MKVPKLRSPIVLVHGLLGFDRFTVAGWTIAQYFSGIPELLSEAGNRVLIPQLPLLGGVAERAACLKVFLDKHALGESVHLIAHSMGGLDSRYMISKLGMAKRVLSLTTLGTPHRGSAFADWGMQRLQRVAEPVFQFFSLSPQSFHDLTTAKCREFNERVPDAPGVVYHSVAGRYDGDWRRFEWLLPHQIVLRAEGPNDGVVSIASARYGAHTEIWEGDHLSLVNWGPPLASGPDRRPKYAALIERLADEGFA